MSAPPITPTRTAALASWCLSALAEELADSDGGPVGVTLIAPGGRPPPADWCCTGEDADGNATEGMAWVRVDTRYPTERFPAASTSATRCGTATAVILELGVYRCAATLDDEGTPPAPERVTADALLVDSDSYAIQAAICRLRWPHVLGGWSSLGPSGGIVGGAQLFTVLLTQGPIGREKS